MSNYPDDIHNFDHEYSSPFYKGPDSATDADFQDSTKVINSIKIKIDDLKEQIIFTSMTDKQILRALNEIRILLNHCD